MKIAVISDVHGNIDALDAVLMDAASEGAERIVNLGDICSGPLFPCETADRLMALNLPTISGNHERQLLTYDFGSMGLSDQYAATTLRADQKEWLKGLPKTMKLEDDVLLVHGTPDSDVGYFLDTVAETGLRPATDDEIKMRAADRDFKLILCGHTHIPRAVRLEHRLFVNPGSVGLQAYQDDRPFPHAVENTSPHARYAIVSKTGGEWSCELRKVAYAWEKAAQLAEERGREDWARALRTGRV
jgi:putative phosphoesterase